MLGGWHESMLDFVPILFVVFGIGALNTSFVKDGEVSVPLSYVTGTLVKMGQGIERHLAGGKVEDWLGYFLLHASFVLGAAAGGAISMVVTGPQMLAVAAVVCAATTGYTYLHADREGWSIKSGPSGKAALSSAQARRIRFGNLHARNQLRVELAWLPVALAKG